MDRKQRNIAILLTTLAVMIGISAVLSELFDTSRDLASIATWTPVPWTSVPKTVLEVTPTDIPPTEALVISTASPTIKRNNACVYPLAYWVYHREIWPVPISVKGFRFTQEAALAVLEDPYNEGTNGLLKEYIVANLNVSRGADPSALGLTLSYTQDWLQMHPIGSEISEDDLQIGKSLQSTLVRFNNGELGSILCVDAFEVPTPIPPTPTRTKTATPTQRNTVVIVPSRATQTKEPGGGPSVPPTSPPQPTQPPKPTDPPPPPTEPPPPPTEPPPPPTPGPTEPG